MSMQLLFYRSAVPVTRARHGDWAVEMGTDYAFSGDVNSVPLMAVEFPEAAGEYPIVFAGSEDEMVPAVILGVRGNENLFLSRSQDVKVLGAKGQGWAARYVPAFVRRYPFVFSRSGDRFLLCVDEEFSGFNRDGRGQKLFDEAGEASPYVQNVLKFLQEYEAQFRRTQAFCRLLRELDVLEPMQAQVTVDSGQQMALGGFLAVSRAKLKALPPEALSRLAQSDALELLYLHLQSMRNFEGLRERLESVLGSVPAASPASEAPLPGMGGEGLLPAGIAGPALH